MKKLLLLVFIPIQLVAMKDHPAKKKGDITFAEYAQTELPCGRPPVDLESATDKQLLYQLIEAQRTTNMRFDAVRQMLNGLFQAQEETKKIMQDHIFLLLMLRPSTALDNAGLCISRVDERLVSLIKANFPDLLLKDGEKNPGYERDEIFDVE